MNENNSNTLLTLLAVPVIMLGVLIASIPFALLYSWGLQKLYGWFVVPLGAPELHLLHIYGLMLIVSLLVAVYKGTDSNKNKDESEKGWLEALTPLLAPAVATLIIVLIGFIVKQFI